MKRICFEEFNGRPRLHPSAASARAGSGRHDIPAPTRLPVARKNVTGTIEPLLFLTAYQLGAPAVKLNMHTGGYPVGLRCNWEHVFKCGSQSHRLGYVVYQLVWAH